MAQRPMAGGVEPELALDPAQTAMVAARRSTLLLGPAGTGKTTALQRATAAVAAERGGHAVVAITADRAEARRWQAAVARMVSGAAPAVTTVAGLAQQVLAGTGPLGVLPQQAVPSAIDTDDLGRAAADLRTLTAPEQEMRIREILSGTQTSGSVDWPTDWKAALPTRTFARQLRRAVAHARRWGWEPDDLYREAVDAQDPGWAAIAQFLAEYLQVLDWEGALDYSDLALRAWRRCAAQPSAGRPDLVVVVDDAHLLDPTQQRFVQAVAGRGHVLAAGDPDQCVASYRGADLSALSGLAVDSDVLVAGTVYRGGARQRDARRSLLGRRWYAGLPVAHAGTYRTPATCRDHDVIDVVEFDDAVSQAAHLAARLRAAHRSGVAWRDMAVLVMRPGTELPALTRGLGQARIPVHVPTADVALVDHPAVATLLAAARLVLAPDPAVPGLADRWVQVATSDLGGVSTRRLRELSRRIATDATHPPSEWPGALLRDPVAVVGLPDHLEETVRQLDAVNRRITAARRLQARDAAPVEVLWQLWHGGDDAWPQRLRRRAEGLGEGAIAAGRDLDAVIALFRLAERAPERWGGRRGLASLIDELEHQEIPAEPDLKQGSRTDSVSLVSLHRSLGRSWPVVVVTGLQESNWQSGDGGEGLIQPGRLDDQGLSDVVPRRAAAEQRRLFNVALSRAGDTLVLTACGGPDDPPTQLLADAGLTPRRVRGAPEQPQTPVATLLHHRRAALRSAATDDERPDGGSASVRALAALTQARRDDGSSLFPGMDPQRWDGACDWTVGPVPLRPADLPLSLSGSALSLLDQCSLRWLLQRELKGDRLTGPQAGFGLAVHAAAAALVAGDDREPGQILADLWGSVSYDAGWQADRERIEAEAAVARAAAWLATRPVPVRAEQRLDVQLPVRSAAGDIIDRLRISGSADVVEVHDDHVLIWDYKTQRSAIAAADAVGNVQLAVYQLAVEQMVGVPARGAGLVQLCVAAGAAEPDQPKVRQQPPVADLADRTSDLLVRSAGAIRDEQFTPTPGPGCRTCPFTASCPAQRPGGPR